jgi:drug/metabolite transporter (DMT)-like permease
LVFLWIFSAVAILISGEGLSIPVKALNNIVMGSILGPFLTAITGYLALQYIPLSHKAVIGSLKGVFVLLGSLIYFGLFPNPTELWGGIISIMGVLLISVGKIRR